MQICIVDFLVACLNLIGQVQKNVEGEQHTIQPSAFQGYVSEIFVFQPLSMQYYPSMSSFGWLGFQEWH